MYVLYSLALSLGFLILLPYFVFQALRFGKYKEGLKQRLGWLPPSLSHTGRPTIWVHAVSVGEFLAAQPLIEALLAKHPDHRFVVSTTTVTGQQLARTRLDAHGGNSSSSTPVGGIFYFPFDWVFSVRRALDHLKPKAVVILETELWPNFLRECRRRGIPTVLANGRLSVGSYRGYLRFRRFIRRVVADLSLLVMQSEEDAARARSLGARPDQVRVCGNLKYDAFGQLSDPHEDVGAGLDVQFGLSDSRHLIVAGSTAAGEEAMLIEALREIRNREQLSDTRLLIAPRRPERFEEVFRLLVQAGFKPARRSDAANETSRSAPVMLLDTIGELAAAYRFASVVFVGGSLVTRGGHNILEPAFYGKPIVVGPHTDNFRQIVADFTRHGAVFQLKPAGRSVLTRTLASELARLLLDGELARGMGARGRDILLKSQGAAECTVSAIRPLLESG